MGDEFGAGAHRICRFGELMGDEFGAGAHRTCSGFSHSLWRPHARAGLRAPHPRAGPAPPLRTGRAAPVNPRMLGQ
ncbi:MAG: hypothetical protein MI924_16520, partial [Chloroflexales bacterium]|nr:hypothetical protein [Chloroflexales bacterium]